MRLGNIEPFVYGSLSDSLWDSVRRSAWNAVCFSVWDCVRVPAGLSTWDYSTWSSVRDSVRSGHETR